MILYIESNKVPYNPDKKQGQYGENKKADQLRTPFDRQAGTDVASYHGESPGAETQGKEHPAVYDEYRQSCQDRKSVV
jgi:hypothetical protein